MAPRGEKEVIVLVECGLSTVEEAVGMEWRGVEWNGEREEEEESSP